MWSGAAVFSIPNAQSDCTLIAVSVQSDCAFDGSFIAVASTAFKLYLNCNLQLSCS
jgi:hypothetical protein